MATYDASDLKIEFDVTVGGALQDISSVVIDKSGFKTNMAMDDITPFGTDWSSPVSGGLKTIDDITLTVQYTDVSTTGTKALFVGKEGEIRTYKETYGSTNSSAVETIIMTVEKNVTKGQIDRLVVVLHPTGAVTEA